MPREYNSGVLLRIVGNSEAITVRPVDELVDENGVIGKVPHEFTLACVMCTRDTEDFRQFQPVTPMWDALARADLASVQQIPAAIRQGFIDENSGKRFWRRHGLRSAIRS